VVGDIEGDTEGGGDVVEVVAVVVVVDMVDAGAEVAGRGTFAFLDLEDSRVGDFLRGGRELGVGGTGKDVEVTMGGGEEEREFTGLEGTGMSVGGEAGGIDMGTSTDEWTI
jgi:hypothetical protein